VERLIALDHELLTRDRIDQEAARRIDLVERGPDPLDRGAERLRSLEHSLDLDIDLGP
jgi:hypothetical protein